MGLSGPRKRVKLSHDPNNTKWTNNTDSFGHKIMASQGWQPGQLLGAKDAPHAEFHTAANASHIRVFLKDDNLGLGAKIGSGVGHGECTGLDVFQNLLGRLNGKDEEQLEKEQKSRDDLKIALYAERKWGIRFIKGGLLVGDKIQDLIDREAERIKELEEERKDSGILKSESNSSGDEMDKSKESKSRREMKIKEESAEIVVVKSKKSKRKRESEEKSDPPKQEQAVPEDINEPEVKVKKEPDVDSEVDIVGDRDTSKQRKKEKEKENKKDKKHKKEKKAKKEKEQKEKDSSSTSEGEISKEEKKRLKKEKRKAKLEAASTSSVPTPESTTKESTPSVPATTSSSGRSTPLIQGRHLVRSRNIAQKRMASMDAAALNQVCTID
ncbi:hypothetical protein F5884DRAFT_817746 [Xylogone sp. PMI_703]|nr:hypothetical protein F5884DRAFT_817746 [Xylogone sp. PMI_703]